MTCIIVGGGIAGFQAAMTCRAVWPDRAVTLIDAEKRPVTTGPCCPSSWSGRSRRRSSSSGTGRMIRSNGPDRRPREIPGSSIPQL